LKTQGESELEAEMMGKIGDEREMNNSENVRCPTKRK
jgi:hypothetical protein